MNIGGDWYNELGSKMILTVNGRKLTGSYQTRVGDAQGMYDLVGWVDTAAHPNHTVGWVVLWENAFKSTDSLTAWSGEYQVIDDEETITSTWLLTIETNPDEDWKSTLVGKDVFTRTAPDATLIVKKAQAKGPSHPLKA